jgi:hypothetical protein
MNERLLKIFGALILFVFMASGAFAVTIQITTGSGTLEGIKDHVGAWLTSTESTVLIIQANGGIIHGMDPTKPYYLGGGDTFLASVEIGNEVIGPALGRFNKDAFVASDTRIYVRAFDDHGIASATYYGNSELFYVTPEGFPGAIHDGDSWNMPDFQTDQEIDLIPPGPPINFTATPETTGNIYLTWTNTNEPDLARVIIRYKATGAFPTTETDGLSCYDAPASHEANDATTHTGLTNGLTYRYSAFSRDTAGNYSTEYATAMAVSADLIPPEVIDYLPKGSGVPTNADVWLYFSEAMNRPGVVSAFSIYPFVTVEGFNWTPDSKTLQVQLGNLGYSTAYIVSLETTATDVAGNHLDPTPYVSPSPFHFSFTTQSPAADMIPPIISNFRIDDRIVFNGDVISSRPKITALISDEGDPAGIASTEVRINSLTRYSGTPGSAFNTTTGTFEYRVPQSERMRKGTYSIDLRAWDFSGNPSQEGRISLKVYGDEIGVVGPILNYPNPFAPGRTKRGTTIAYTLKSDFDVALMVYDPAAHLVWKKKMNSGDEGAHVGYNEVYWNGKKASGELPGNGIYIMELVGAEKIQGTCKMTVLD